jgi:dihydrodipicolinate synthase/N-acetylneuraminate lyase
MRRLIDFELEVGAHGGRVLGFMGEAHRLAGVDRRQVVAVSVDQAAGAFPVRVGVPAFGAARAIEQAIFDTALVRPPGMKLDEVTRSELEAVIRRVGLDLDTAGPHPVSIG